MPGDNVLFAFALTLFAGLSTGIGSAIAFFAKHTNTRFLAVSLGFSAGVMLYVSFVEILPKAREALAGEWGEATAAWAAVGAFFGGIVLIALIDRFVPESKNPHEAHAVEELDCPGPGAPCANRSRASLYKTGIFTALAIAIHNFPEGFATFAAALSDPKLGIPIAVAIAIHNIPEGIAVSVPVFYATGNRRKAFLLSFLSGLSEPLGALVGYLVLRSVFNEVVFGLSFAAVGGIMVYISLDELLPSAQKFGEHHHAIAGVMVGMAVMASSLLLFL